MKFAQTRSAVTVVLTLAAILIVHQPALGQSELKEFAASLDEAKLHDEILLVYFFSPESDHPRDLLELVSIDSRESFGEEFRLLRIDLSTPQGFDIADAFFGIGDLEVADQGGPILGVVHRDGRRGISLLPASAEAVDPGDWLLFEKNVSKK